MGDIDASDQALNVPAKGRTEEEIERLLDSSDVDKLRSILNDSEVVHKLILCQMDGNESVLAATNERMLFCDQRFITSSTISLEYPDVAALIYNPEMISVDLTIVHLGRSLHVENVDKDRGLEFVSHIENLIGDHYKPHGTNGRVLEYINDAKYSEEVAVEAG